MVLRFFCLLLAVCQVSTAGCFFFTTKREGRQLRLELGRLKGRLDTMRKNEHRLKRALAKARLDQAKLEKILVEARKVLLRNSADLGAKVQILESQLGKVLGRLENVESELKAGKKLKPELIRKIQVIRMDLAGLKQRVQSLHTRPAEPQGADAIFQHAQKNFHAGAYAVARKYYKKFALTYPTDGRAAFSLYQVGLSYFKENKYGAADYSFKQLLRRFPSGKYAPRALFYRARCHFELKYCKSALNILSQLRKRFPGSKVAGDALRMFQRVRRLLRNSRYCGS